MVGSPRVFLSQWLWKAGFRTTGHKSVGPVNCSQCDDLASSLGDKVRVNCNLCGWWQYALPGRSICVWDTLTGGLLEGTIDSNPSNSFKICPIMSHFFLKLPMPLHPTQVKSKVLTMVFKVSFLPKPFPFSLALSDSDTLLATYVIWKFVVETLNDKKK